MYAGGQDHPLREPCRRVLRLIESGRLDAITSAEVIQEILHRFTHIGRRDLGAEMASATLDLFGFVLPITDAVMRRMPTLIQRYERLSARDLVHVATCLEEGIEAIITPDRAFDEVAELARISPEGEIVLSHIEQGRP